MPPVVSHVEVVHPVLRAPPPGVRIGVGMAASPSDLEAANQLMVSANPFEQRMGAARVGRGVEGITAAGPYRAPADAHVMDSLGAIEAMADGFRATVDSLSPGSARPAAVVRAVVLGDSALDALLAATGNVPAPGGHPQAVPFTPTRGVMARFAAAVLSMAAHPEASFSDQFSFAHLHGHVDEIQRRGEFFCALRSFAVEGVPGGAPSDDVPGALAKSFKMISSSLLTQAYSVARSFDRQVCEDAVVRTFRLHNELPLASGQAQHGEAPPLPPGPAAAVQFVLALASNAVRLHRARDVSMSIAAAAASVPSAAGQPSEPAATVDQWVHELHAVSPRVTLMRAIVGLAMNRAPSRNIEPLPYGLAQQQPKASPPGSSQAASPSSAPPPLPPASSSSSSSSAAAASGRQSVGLPMDSMSVGVMGGGGGGGSSGVASDDAAAAAARGMVSDGRPHFRSRKRRAQACKDPAIKRLRLTDDFGQHVPIRKEKRTWCRMCGVNVKVGDGYKRGGRTTSVVCVTCDSTPLCFHLPGDGRPRSCWHKWHEDESLE